MKKTKKKAKTNTVTIAGQRYRLIECDLRFERTDLTQEDAIYASLDTCLRVGIRKENLISREGLTVQHLNPTKPYYVLWDASFFEDINGNAWIKTDLGLECMLCSKQAKVRELRSDNINPFTKRILNPKDFECESDVEIIQERLAKKKKKK